MSIYKIEMKHTAELYTRIKNVAEQIIATHPELKERVEVHMRAITEDFEKLMTTLGKEESETHRPAHMNWYAR